MTVHTPKQVSATVKPFVKRNAPGHADSGGEVVAPFRTDDEMNTILDALTRRSSAGVKASQVPSDIDERGELIERLGRLSTAADGSSAGAKQALADAADYIRRTALPSHAGEDDGPSDEEIETFHADAAKWANGFRRMALHLGYSDMDEGWLITWFANAIERADAVRHPSPSVPPQGETILLHRFRPKGAPEWSDWRVGKLKFSDTVLSGIEGQEAIFTLTPSPTLEPSDAEVERAWLWSGPDGKQQLSGFSLTPEQIANGWTEEPLVTASVSGAMVARACQAYRNCQGPMDLENFMTAALEAALIASRQSTSGERE